MKKAAKIVWETCMALKPSEKALIVFDEKKGDIAKAFLEAGRDVTKNVKGIMIPLAKVSGQEPPENVADEMLKSDVILLITSHSLSHTKARRDAKKAGARIASMPGITEDIVKRALDVDYIEMDKVADKIIGALKGKKELHIVSPSGTDIKIPNKGFLKDTGLYHKKPDFGNLPAGEISFGPEEGKTNGKYVVDLTMAGVGKLDEPITFVVKHGYVSSITGGKQADELKKILDSVGDDRVYNVAELGIGTNKNARVSGVTLEDEKALGTIHIALGNNMSYPGGTTNVALHLDGVISKPTIIADGKTVMKGGILIEQ